MNLFTANYSWLSYFEPHANRLLSPSSFPREAKIMNRKDALRKFEIFFLIVKQMVFELPEKVRDLEGLLVR